MNATLEDAHLLFNRWKETGPPLQIKLISAALVFQGVGMVLDFAPGSLQLGGDSWQFTVPLAEAGYTFSDPREIAIASIREAEASRYEFGLSLNLANGDRLTLLELKPQEAAEEDD